MRDSAKVLESFDRLPDDAVLTTRDVALIHPGISERTIRRQYPTIRLSPRRLGVRVGDLRAISRGAMKL